MRTVLMFLVSIFNFCYANNNWSDIRTISSKVNSKNIKSEILSYYKEDSLLCKEVLSKDDFSLRKFPIEYKGYSFYSFSLTNLVHSNHEIYIRKGNNGEILWSINDLVSWLENVVSEEDYDVANSILWHYFHLPKYRKLYLALYRKGDIEIRFPGYSTIVNYGIQDWNKHKKVPINGKRLSGLLYESRDSRIDSKIVQAILEWQLWAFGHSCSYQLIPLHNDNFSKSSVFIIENEDKGYYAYSLFICYDKIQIYELEYSIELINGKQSKTQIYDAIIREIILSDLINNNSDKYNLITKITGIIEQIGVCNRYDSK